MFKKLSVESIKNATTVFRCARAAIVCNSIELAVEISDETSPGVSTTKLNSTNRLATESLAQNGQQTMT